MKYSSITVESSNSKKYRIFWNQSWLFWFDTSPFQNDLGYSDISIWFKCNGKGWRCILIDQLFPTVSLVLFLIRNCNQINPFLRLENFRLNIDFIAVRLDKPCFGHSAGIIELLNGSIYYKWVNKANPDWRSSESQGWKRKRSGRENSRIFPLPFPSLLENIHFCQKSKKVTDLMIPLKLGKKYNLK